MRVMADMRDPEPWLLSTFNEHAFVGTVEVIQNYFLDFEEAAGNDYKEQWVICETFAYFMPTGYSAAEINE